MLNLDPVLTVATVPAVVALVNLLKSLGITGRWALLAAVALGVLLSVAEYALGSYGWWEAAASGLLLGLAAAGLYDLTPGSAQPRHTAEEQE